MTMKKVGILLVVAAMFLGQAGPAMAQNNARQVIVFVCAFPQDGTFTVQDPAAPTVPTVVSGTFQAFPTITVTPLVPGNCAQTISNVTTDFPQLRLTAVTHGPNSPLSRTQYTFAAQ
jgi:hypothetical protein